MKVTGYDDEHMIFGLLFILGNRLQTIGDGFYEGITCKQWFVLVGISVFKEESPTINELADVIGSSHQNVKQLLLKLEKAGFVTLYTDDKDRRKLRVKMTEKCYEFDRKYAQKQEEFFDQLYDRIGKKELRITKDTLLQLEQNLLNIGG